MKVCSDYHEEIVYTGLSCPLCGLIEQNDRLNKEVEKLNK